MEEKEAVPRFGTWKDELAWCEQIAKSNLVPSALRRRPEDVYVIFLTARDLGISSMLGLRSIYIVEGKPYLAADLIAALILRSDHVEEFAVTETTMEQATVTIMRKGWKAPKTFTFTAIEAKHLIDNPKKENWKFNRRAMLRARAISQAGRLYFPDVVAGLYSEADDDFEPGPIVAATSVVATDGGPADERATMAVDRVEALIKVLQEIDPKAEDAIARLDEFAASAKAEIDEVRLHSGLRSMFGEIRKMAEEHAASANTVLGAVVPEPSAPLAIAPPDPVAELQSIGTESTDAVGVPLASEVRSATANVWECPGCGSQIAGKHEADCPEKPADPPPVEPKDGKLFP